jgi:predicted XRE-type DNA-binding protein
MTTIEELELVRGSGNVFRDFGYVDAEALHLKAKLAARIIGILEDEKLSAKSAGEATGVSAAEFSRIRNAKLGKFSIERMLKILAVLGQDVDVSVTFNSRSEPDWRRRA